MSSRSLRRSFLCAAIAALPSVASAQSVLNASGGTTSSNGLRIDVGALSQVQVTRTGSGQLYSRSVRPAASGVTGSLYNGVYLAVGTTVIGPTHTAGPSGGVDWDAVSQTGGSATGTGTSTTTLRKTVGGRSYEVRMQVDYTGFNDYATVTLTLNVPAGNTSTVRLYHALDAFLDGSDSGLSFARATTPPTVGVYTANLVEGFRYRSGAAWTGYYAGTYNCMFNAGGCTGSEASQAIADAANFSNWVNPGNVDDAFGIMWNVGSAPGTYVTSNDLFFQIPRPVVTASFGAASVAPSGTTTLSLRITNYPGNPPQAGMALTVALPSGLVLAAAPAAAQCGGTVAGTTGGSTLTLAGGALSSGSGGCTISVTVRADGSAFGTLRLDASRTTGLANLSSQVDASLDVLCATNADCPASAPVCNPSTHLCVPCNGATGGAGCTAPSTCATSGADTGRCVGCLSNANCSGATPVCDVPTRTCIGCLSNADCSGATPVCDATSRACVACNAPGAPACSAGLVCVPFGTGAGRCVQCRTNAQCTGSTPFCDTGAFRCVACLANADCGAATPLCDASHVCVACTAPGAPACPPPSTCATSGASSGRCVSCSTDAQCGGTTPVCRDSACVPCTTPGAVCPSGMPTCITTGSQAGACAQCRRDADCAAGQFCDTGSFRCAPKLVNGTAVPTIANHDPVLNGTCSEPVASAVCVSGACDVADRACGLANDHGPCTGANGIIVCRSGVCSGDSRCGFDVGEGPCTAATGAIVCRSGTCGARGTCIVPGTCDLDRDCNASQFCNTQTHRCVARLPNGGAVPRISGHVPALESMCTAEVGAAVCQSAVCDPLDHACGLRNGSSSCSAANGGIVCRSTICDTTDGRCGYANGNGSCTAANAAIVCRSGVCGRDGRCGLLDNEGPCNAMTASTVCRSGACNAGNVCLAPRTCTADTECSALQFCNTGTGICTMRLTNGLPVPTISGHTPPLTGTCNADVGAAVCVARACDPADHLCGWANDHGACTATNATALCRSGVCGGDGRCGLAISEGSCTASTARTVCRSGACGASGRCIPPGGCVLDADCAGSQYCDTAALTCAPQRANGQPLPTVVGHVPPLDGTCTAEAGTVACVSGVCDADDQRCGFANDHGPCSAMTATGVCRSTVCGSDGRCGFPDGEGPCTDANGMSVCRSGTCARSGVCAAATAPCSADQDCPANSTCDPSSGRCVPGGGGADAGVDGATSTDASLPRDGSADARVDAGTDAATETDATTTVDTGLPTDPSIRVAGSGLISCSARPRTHDDGHAGFGWIALGTAVLALRRRGRSRAD